MMTIIEVADLKVEVVRKWIRNIYLRVSPTDARIRISAPVLMSERAIRQFVLAKEAWIRQRLRRVGERRAPAPREYLSGELHYYMGQGYRLQVVHGNGLARVERADGDQISYIYARGLPRSSVRRRCGSGTGQR